jgi:pSer/pThr/pTyr-binding forkhead associated (FHA) protein
VFEDLGSTNGTWLNGQRLPSDTTYPIKNGDQLWLGQFQLQICFLETAVPPTTTFTLQGAAFQPGGFTPDMLLTRMGPWLTAAASLQKIASQCLHQEQETLRITKIEAVAGSHVTIHAANNPDAIHLIQKWVTPWQQRHEGSRATQAVQQAMVQLAAKILADIAPNLNNQEKFRLIEELIPILTTLTASSIHLSVEAG